MQPVTDPTMAASIAVQSSATFGSLVRRLAIAALLLTGITVLASIALVSSQ